MGVGECAGEVVSMTQFGLAASERQAFEAQILLDNGDYHKAPPPPTRPCCKPPKP